MNIDPKSLEVDISKVQFDMRKLNTINSKHTPEQKMAAVIAFVMTGSGKEAAMMADVSYTCFRQWKRYAPWWSEAVIAAQTYLNQKLDGTMTKIINTIMVGLEQNIIKGEQKMTPRGEIVYLKPSTSSLVSALNVLFGIRERAREAELSLKDSKKIAPEEKSLSDMALEFAQLSKEAS